MCLCGERCFIGSRSDNQSPGDERERLERDGLEGEVLKWKRLETKGLKRLFFVLV